METVCVTVPTGQAKLSSPVLTGEQLDVTAQEAGAGYCLMRLSTAAVVHVLFACAEVIYSYAFHSNQGLCFRKVRINIIDQRPGVFFDVSIVSEEAFDVLKGGPDGCPIALRHARKLCDEQ